MKHLLFILLLTFQVHSKVEIVGSEIHITDDPNFEAKLEEKQFIRANKEAHLMETGFIVANTQSSFENDRIISRWVSLDDVVLKNNKVDLKSIPPMKGYAYGIIATSKDYESQLKIGQAVNIQRYGLDKDNFIGEILSVRKKSQDVIQVHFLASNALELIAGTTCEVEISQIKMIPYKVSLLSLLHLGAEDYILIKKGKGVYYPKHATILDQDSTSATVLVPLEAQANYIARGAILLKPLLNQIVAPKKEEL